MKTLRLLPPLALLALTAAGPALAALPESGRLTLDITVKGSGGTRGTQGKTSFKSAQSAHMAVTLHPVAGLEPINRLDSADAQQGYTQLTVATQARMPSETEAQRFAGQMQKEAAACNNDVACLQRVGEKASRMTMAWTGTPAMPQPAEGRYLNFSGMRLDECDMEYAVRIDDSIEGSIDDVGGPVPYLDQRKADYKGGERDATFLCTSMATLDTQADRLWVAASLPAPQGQVTHAYGKDRRSSAPSDGIGLQKEALAWVVEQLHGKVPRAGSRRTTLRLPLTVMGQKGEQLIDVDMRWRFDTK